MTAVGFAVLGLFTLSVAGLLFVILNDHTEQDHDDQRADDEWLRELRRINHAMPYVRKHRARQRKRVDR